MLNCEIYNYRELAEKYGIEGRNDAEVAANLLFEKGIDAIKEFDGIFAGAFFDGSFLYLFRDPIGVNPLFYREKPFIFSSERLYIGDIELFPRNIAIYDPDSRETYEKRFFGNVFRKCKRGFIAALKRAVKKREHKEGVIFFSGGIDSSVIASMSKLPLITVATPRSKDYIRAKEVADILGKELIIEKIDVADIKEALGILARRLGRDPVKVEVAVVTYLAARIAKEYGFKVALSGSGADELFYGYKRMHRSVERETKWAIRNMYEKNLYRDNVAAFLGGVELRVPFLDREVICSALGIPTEKRYRKKLLVEYLKEKTGIKEWKKSAAQYSSGVSKFFGKRPFRVIKRYGFRREKPAAYLLSGGKDSWYSLMIAERRGYVPGVVINYEVKTEDSWMFQYPLSWVAAKQAELSGYRVIKLESSGRDEDALKELVEGMKIAKEKYKAEVVVSGAMSSEYQREKIETATEEVGLASIAPLWGADPESYLRTLVKSGFSFVIVHVAADGLSHEHLGRIIDAGNVEKWIEIAREHRFNPAGEGGEYETVVLKGPVLSRRAEIWTGKLLRSIFGKLERL